MKRRTKLILLVAVLGCLGGLGVVLSKIAKEAGVPFPGAVVVLDDASWRARYKDSEFQSSYLWANAETILYRQKVARGYSVVRRKVLSDRIVTAPETLPIVIGKKEHISSLSPDGTTLCIVEVLQGSHNSYQLVRTDGKEKPIRFLADVSRWYWSPDSQSLYGTDGFALPPPIERFDAKTGAVSKTTLDTKEKFDLETITPEGKPLGFEYDFILQAGQEAVQWKIKEARGKQVVTTTYQKRFRPSVPRPTLSPDGKRILWYLYDEENSLLEKVQQKLFRKKIAPHGIVRYLTTDVEGKNERMIGAVPLEIWASNNLDPEWTPDGKGVSFLQDGKLMYLAVP